MVALSPRAFHLVRTFRAAFAALDDLKDPHEQQQIAEVIAAHLRSSAPLALGATTVEPATEIVVTLTDGARVELRVLDGRINLYVHDALEHDADVGLTQQQAAQLISDARRVLAAMESAHG